MKEMVLYYAPENALHVGLVKGVLVQMGIRIKNLTSGRCKMKIGWSGLKSRRAQGVMKAILTESNAHWTVYELYDHLVEERRQIERR